jgi:hypothetical protein
MQVLDFILKMSFENANFTKEVFVKLSSSKTENIRKFHSNFIKHHPNMSQNLQNDPHQAKIFFFTAIKSPSLLFPKAQR